MQRNGKSVDFPEMYRLILENITDSVIVTDDRGVMQYVCPNVTSIFGRSRSEIYSFENIENVMGGRVCDREELHREAEIKNIEWSIRDGGGRKHHLLVNVISIDIDIGTTLYVMRDVTDYHALNEALRESQCKYRALFDAAGWGIGYWSPGGRVVSFNPTALADLQGNLYDFIGKSAVEIFGRELGERINERIEMVVTTRSQNTFEDTILLPGGKKTYLATYCAVEDYEGEVLGVQIIASDITERKRADSKYRRVKKSLEDAQRLAKVGCWEWNIVHDTLWWSDEMYRIFGRDPDVGPPTFESWWNVVHPDDLHQLRGAVEASFTSGSYATDYRLLREDSGEVRDVHALGKVEFDAQKNGVKLIGAVKDITRERRLEAQLRQAQKMESIGTLAGGIAHDFNNILSSILGFTELALDEVDKGSSLEDSLLEVYDAGKRARDLVRQILTFARKTDGNLAPIRVDLIAKEVLKMLRSSLPATIEIQKRLDCAAYIIGNPTEVHQIFMNLCTNAAQAMAEKGGVLEVRLQEVTVDASTQETLPKLKMGRYLEILVADSGVGIGPDVLGMIFEPYYSTKIAGEGTGLGLALVYAIVESYEGVITVQSILGQGSTFRVYLPVTSRHGAQHKDVIGELPRGSERILLIDDEIAICKFGKRILEQLGYTVTSLTSSEEALALFRSQPDGYDLVITDMTMPQMTGDRLARELMNIRADIPIIICSGYSNKMTEQSAAALGIRAFLNKPVIGDEMATAVREVLDQCSTGEV